MRHYCKNLLIRCIDFRLNDELEKWTKNSGFFEGGFDVISIPGSSKDLSSENLEIRSNFLKHIGISVNLHKVEKIIIFHHSDCGAYSRNRKFNSSEEERKVQLKDMKEAKEIILKKYSEVEIILVWGELKDNNKDGQKIDFQVFKTDI